MWKKFFYSTCIVLLSWFNNSILANEIDNQPLYLNILDLTGTFEENLSSAYSNMKYQDSPVLLEEMFYGCSSSTKLYHITREYNSTSSDVFADMNAKEEYILRIFKNKYISEKGSTLSIEEFPIYSTWFADYLAIEINNEDEQSEIKQGMLPFLNTKYLKLVNNNTKDLELITDEAAKILLAQKSSFMMNQLFEMAGGAARQMKLQNSIRNPNILGTFIKDGIPLLDIPDNTLLNTINSDKHNNINKILTFMYDITKGLEFLHKKNIAHGDIKLTNIFTISDKVVLSGFERFSLLDSSIDNLGVKNFTFYNSVSHAPEMRLPLGEDRKWCYTNATLEGDIYSLGMAFAGLLYIYIIQFDFDKLTAVNDLLYYINEQKIKSIFFNKDPKTVKQDAKKQTIASMLSYGNKFKSCQLQEDYSDILNKLIDIINSCHQQSPSHRPTATEIKDMLSNIIKEASSKNINLQSEDTKL